MYVLGTLEASFGLALLSATLVYDVILCTSRVIALIPMCSFHDVVSHPLARLLLALDVSDAAFCSSITKKREASEWGMLLGMSLASALLGVTLVSCVMLCFFRVIALVILCNPHAVVSHSLVRLSLPLDVSGAGVCSSTGRLCIFLRPLYRLFLARPLLSREIKKAGHVRSKHPSFRGFAFLGVALVYEVILIVFTVIALFTMPNLQVVCKLTRWQYRRGRWMCTSTRHIQRRRRSYQQVKMQPYEDCAGKEVHSF